MSKGKFKNAFRIVDADNPLVDLFRERGYKEDIWQERWDTFRHPDDNRRDVTINFPTLASLLTTAATEAAVYLDPQDTSRIYDAVTGFINRYSGSHIGGIVLPLAELALVYGVAKLMHKNITALREYFY